MIASWTRARLMTQPASPRRFYRALALLREHAPPVLPVRVRRVDLRRRTDGAVWGVCDLVHDDEGKALRFDILIERTLREPSLTDTLAHEFAHALGWTTKHPAFREHGDEFGLAYARCYRALEALEA